MNFNDQTSEETPSQSSPPPRPVRLNVIKSKDNTLVTLNPYVEPSTYVIVDSTVKGVILLTGAEVGHHVVFAADYVQTGNQVIIGNSVEFVHDVNLGSGTVVGIHLRTGGKCVVSHGVTVGDYAAFYEGLQAGGNFTTGERSFIGAESRIGDNARIGDRSIICSGTEIGECATFGAACIILPDTTIGRCAKFGNGCFIQDGVKLGAGSVFGEGLQLGNCELPLDWTTPKGLIFCGHEVTHLLQFTGIPTGEYRNSETVRIGLLAKRDPNGASAIIGYGNGKHELLCEATPNAIKVLVNALITARSNHEGGLL